MHFIELPPPQKEVHYGTVYILIIAREKHSEVKIFFAPDIGIRVVTV